MDSIEKHKTLAVLPASDPKREAGSSRPPLNAPTMAFTPTTFVTREESASPDRPAPQPDNSVTSGGKPFGDYDLLREIARGGMGVVYKARHRKLQRVVALKMILSGQFASPEDVQRFSAEAQAAANLDHPGIVPIYEVGECEGRHYYAMGYVHGISLAVELADGPMEPTKAAELAEKIAEAVQYAHDRGVVHRDLKPANVLLDEDHQPRVTDFGLAKQLAQDSHLTASGQVLGTPSYMPPEQASGDLARIGPLSDVYSIGAILYAQLTGRPPFFAASSVDTLRQVLEREPVSPRVLNPKIPTDLDTICLKCLQKEPARRYASARDLAADLSRFLQGEPVLARPVSSLDRALKWARRRPALAALWGLVIVLAVSGVGGISWQWWRAEVSARRSRDLAIIAQDERDDAQKARDETKRELRRSLLLQSRAGRFSGLAGRRFSGLEAVARGVEIAPGDDLRDEAIACLALADVRVERAIRFAQPVPPGVVAAFDPLVERYAISDAQGTITIHEVKSDAPLAELAGPGMAIAWILRFSPDGKFLAAKHESPGESLVQIWDLSKREPVFKTTDPIAFAALDFHPSAAQAALVDASGKLRLVDLESGEELKSWPVEMQPYTICYDPSGTRLAMSNHQEQNVRLFDLTAGRFVAQLPHSSGVRGMSWGPRGRRLATASGLAVCLWDVERTKRIATLEGHGNTVTHVIFTRQGDLLASYGWDNETRFWDPRKGTQLFSLPGEILQFGRFSPDDGLVGYKTSEREIGIWRVAPGRELQTLGVASHQAPHIVRGSFSRDDRLLATASHDGLKLWDAAEQREVLHVPLSQLASAAFAPADQGLLLSDQRGLSLWPLSRSDEPNLIRLQLRATPVNVGSSAPGIGAASRDGKLVALADGTQVEVFDVDSDRRFTRLFTGPHENSASIAVSPDGRWVASGTWKGTGVKVWNVETRTLQRELPVEGNANVAFSPDGTLLGTSTGYDYRLWSVGDWQPGERVTREQGGDVPGVVCFSPDSRTWAVLAGRTGTLRLLSTRGQRVLAELESGPQFPLCFSHDGTRLAVLGNKGRVDVWNLALLGTELSRLSLPAEFVPAGTSPAAGSPENSATLKPLIVEVAPPMAK